MLGFLANEHSGRERHEDRRMPSPCVPRFVRLLLVMAAITGSAEARLIRLHAGAACSH